MPSFSIIPAQRGLYCSRRHSARVTHSNEVSRAVRGAQDQAVVALVGLRQGVDQIDDLVIEVVERLVLSKAGRAQMQNVGVRPGVQQLDDEFADHGLSFRFCESVSESKATGAVRTARVLLK